MGRLNVKASAATACVSKVEPVLRVAVFPASLRTVTSAVARGFVFRAHHFSCFLYAFIISIYSLLPVFCTATLCVFG